MNEANMQHQKIRCSIILLEWPEKPAQDGPRASQSSDSTIMHHAPITSITREHRDTRHEYVLFTATREDTIYA